MPENRPDACLRVRAAAILVHMDSPPSGPVTWRRMAGALPDALTAGYFLMLWLQPDIFGDGHVETGLLIMLVEFLTVHAGGMLGGVALDPDTARRKRLQFIAAVGLFYLAFAAMLMLAFGQWWPLLVIGWLLLAKFLRVLPGRAMTKEEATWQMQLWALSVVLYLGGVVLTLLLPLPRLGLSPDVVATLGIAGSGVWVESPHRLMAFGVLYFGALAAAKGTLHRTAERRRD